MLIFGKYCTNKSDLKIQLKCILITAKMSILRQMKRGIVRNAGEVPLSSQFEGKHFLGMVMTFI